METMTPEVVPLVTVPPVTDSKFKATIVSLESRSFAVLFLFILDLL
jgi:hypothetical protein